MGAVGRSAVLGGLFFGFAAPLFPGLAGMLASDAAGYRAPGRDALTGVVFGGSFQAGLRELLAVDHADRTDQAGDDFRPGPFAPPCWSPG